jgi:hypothetical protein
MLIAGYDLNFKRRKYGAVRRRNDGRRGILGFSCGRDGGRSLGWWPPVNRWC